MTGSHQRTPGRWWLRAEGHYAFILLPPGVLGEGILDLYPPPARNLPRSILFLINWVLVLAAVLALGFLVYGGFRYIASRGDEREIEAAKGTITSAVVGLVVIGVAAAIVNFVVGALLS